MPSSIGIRKILIIKTIPVIGRTAESDSRIFSFNLKDDSFKEFKLLSKIFFNEKLEKEYKVEDLW